MYMNNTAVASVVQHLPPVEQNKVFKLLDRRAQKNQRFRDSWDAAKSKKAAEEEERDELLVRQAEEMAVYRMEDVPW